MPRTRIKRRRNPGKRWDWRWWNEPPYGPHVPPLRYSETGGRRVAKSHYGGIFAHLTGIEALYPDWESNRLGPFGKEGWDKGGHERNPSSSLPLFLAVVGVLGAALYIHSKAAAPAKLPDDLTSGLRSHPGIPEFLGGPLAAYQD